MSIKIYNKTSPNKLFLSYQTQMTDNIKVILRVRPFNQNETGQANIVEM